MKFKILLFIPLTLITACRLNYAPANYAGTGYRMEIRPNKESYVTSPNDTVRVTAVNRSACNIFYQSPSFFATLQRLENGRWKDLGPWYDIIAIVPQTVTCAPGDSIPILFLSTDWTDLQKPGTYAIHLKLYMEKNREHPLPESACRSRPFEVRRLGKVDEP